MFEVMSTWIRSIKDGREGISKSEHVVLTAPQKGVTPRPERTAYKGLPPCSSFYLQPHHRHLLMPIS